MKAPTTRISIRWRQYDKLNISRGCFLHVKMCKTSNKLAIAGCGKCHFFFEAVRKKNVVIRKMQLHLVNPFTSLFGIVFSVSIFMCMNFELNMSEFEP